MANIPNGVYGNRPWQAHPYAAYPPQAYIGPFASNQERLLTQAMEVAKMTPAEVQEYVRPNLPQIAKFPKKYGYVKSAYGIRDIIEVSGRSQERTDYSQVPNVIQSTSRNTLGTV